MKEKCNCIGGCAKPILNEQVMKCQDDIAEKIRAKARSLDDGNWVEGFYFRFNDTHQMALPQLQVFVEIDQSTLLFPELERLKEENK